MSCGPLAAEEPVALDPAAIVALAERPWENRRAFGASLEAALGGFATDMPPLPESLRATDPLLWSITGRFGAALAGSAAPGGIVACSRYGLATRDRLAERDLADPAAFALFGATLAASDDAEVWPEDAVARLACMITWDDARRVAILPEAAARAALERSFGSVSTGRAGRGDEGARGQAPVGDGAQGYRLIGRDGMRDSVVMVESAIIELRPTHQQIRFRAFLLGGGV